jgi:hypothetical protein
MYIQNRNVIANTNSVEQNIAYRQLAIKSNDSKSWFIKIVQITQIYDLPAPAFAVLSGRC